MIALAIDFSFFLVLGLTLAVAAFLVGLEVNSRRNAGKRQAEAAKEASTPATAAEPAGTEAGPPRRRRSA